jgi:hypothetical protein
MDARRREKAKRRSRQKACGQESFRAGMEAKPQGDGKLNRLKKPFPLLMYTDVGRKSDTR